MAIEESLYLHKLSFLFLETESHYAPLAGLELIVETPYPHARLCLRELGLEAWVITPASPTLNF